MPIDCHFVYKNKRITYVQAIQFNLFPPQETDVLRTLFHFYPQAKYCYQDIILYIHLDTRRLQPVFNGWGNNLLYEALN